MSLAMGCPLAAVILSLVSSAFSQTVAPSNSSQDLYPVSTSPRFLLSGNELPDMPVIRLAPLGPYAEISPRAFTSTDVTGHLVKVDDGNPTDNFPDSVRNFFYISCDPEDYGGNLGPSDVFSIATRNPDVYAVILYSTTSDHCSATGLDNLPEIGTVLTTTESMVARALAELDLASNAPGTVQMLPDLNSYTNSSGNSWYQGNGFNRSPTTAVAMIILYAITGLITALFVIIIITGAIRAHRHPERYGPRNIMGRGRQSRARGIARAMLDTLPIVKFGDRDGNAETQKAPSTAGTNADVQTEHARDADIEMTAATAPTATATENKSTETNAPQTTATEIPPTQNEPNTNNTTAVAPGPTSNNPTADAPSCSICTEDFTLGSDMRVLPCQHQFHPECVDPWLLNVSGTCPLCRIDLRPAAEEDAAADDTEGDGLDTSGVDAEGRRLSSAAVAQDGRRRESVAAGFRAGEDWIGAGSLRSGRTRGARRDSAAGVDATEQGGGTGGFAALRRALGGSREERVAALRRYRAERGEIAGTEVREEERRGLAARMRERWRVRTERRDAGAGPPVEPTLGEVRSREHVDGRPL